MFQKKEQSSIATVTAVSSITSTTETVIGTEVSIDGDIQFSGSLRVDGVIHGNVRGAADKSCTLMLSEQGRIEGAIEVPHTVINGTVTGPVKADHYIELQSKARVSGDVYYRTLEIHTGAIVDGKLVYLKESGVVNQELITNNDLDQD
ncbi:MAG: polymer-forming cytoskeletal protein [Methylobacillus sp.]|jgi:cytoskeletal protein CcmA (bactofilin family)|nr:polymer-forming cytoskeletal protein [Methylobacillus sp.]